VSTAKARPLGLEILAGELRGNQLIEDYIRGIPKLAPFYAGWPWDPAPYRTKLADVDRRFGSDSRSRLASIITASTPAARDRLQRIIDGDGVVVTTGQQPSLFGGPLYTVYKVVTAVKLAAALEGLLGRPVSALFWIASNDHDWQEANHAAVIDAGGSLHRIEVTDDGSPPVSMQHRLLGAGVERAFAELAQALPSTEFTPALLERLRSAYRPGDSMAHAFTADVTALFEPLDLLVADACNPALLQAARPVLAKELEQCTQNAALLARQSQRLVDAGYHAQVAIAADAANVMFEDEQGRERLVRENGAWQLRRTKRTFSDAEIHTLLAETPERFSPNVLLRPVVESAVLPTLAYVGGPSEVSYFGQIGCLFEAHAIGMPLVFPRRGVTLVEPKIRKVLGKFGLDVDDLRRPPHDVSAQVVRDELPDDTENALEALRTAIADGYARLQDAAAGIDPTLSGPIGKARNASDNFVRDVEKKILAHLRSRNEVSVEQVLKAGTNLFPGGEPQERVISPVQYLARYGADFLPAVADAIDVELNGSKPEWSGVECGFS
jgi:bacillithiol biosynthesis cysteine-adding enzyme BshC